MKRSETPLEFIEDIRRAIEAQKAVIIAGAGTSIAATGESVASWTGLLESGIETNIKIRSTDSDRWKKWADIRREQIATNDLDEIISAAEEIERKLKEIPNEYSRWLRETIGLLHEKIRAPKIAEAILGLHVRVATTNYDTILEKESGRDTTTWREQSEAERWLRGDSTAIFHLHGVWKDSDSIVLGIRSYEDVIRDPHASETLRSLWGTHTLLFVGFGGGLTDPNFSALLASVRQVHRNSEYRNYRLERSQDLEAAQAQHQNEDHIRVISYGDEYEHLPAFLLSLAPAQGMPAIPLTESESSDSSAFFVPFAPKGDRVVGRARALAALKEAIVSGVYSFGSAAAIVGLGGIGKTQVAVEYCYDFREMYPGGVFWFDCSRNLETQIITFAEQAGWAHRDLPAAEKLAIGARRISLLQSALLVLDDVADVDLIKKNFLSAGSPSRHFLLTSKAEIPPVAAVPARELAITESEALDLLRSESSRAIVSDDNDALTLVRAFDLLPMAIEIAGAFLRFRSSISIPAYMKAIGDTPLDAPVAAGLLDSYTQHAPNLREAVQISDETITEQVLKDILACFGFVAVVSIGIKLLSALMGIPETSIEFISALEKADSLRVLKKESSPSTERWRMHRLVWLVYHSRATQLIDDVQAAVYARRLLLWFKERHEDVERLHEFEAEADQLRFWRGEMVKREEHLIAAELYWLEAYLPYHRQTDIKAVEVLLTSAQRELHESERNDPSLHLRVLTDLAFVNGELNRVDKAQELASEARMVADDADLSGEDKCRAFLSLASVYLARGRYEEAHAAAKTALDAASSARWRANAAIELTKADHSRGRYDDALTTLKTAVDRTVPADLLANLTMRIGHIYVQLKDPPEALRQYRRAEELLLKLYGERHPMNATILFNIGVAYRELGDFQAAEKAQRFAIQLDTDLFGPDHPTLVSFYMGYATTREAQRDVDAALELRRKAFVIAESNLGWESPTTVAAGSALAVSLVNKREWDQALLLSKRAYEWFLERVGYAIWQTTDALSAYVRALWASGQRQKAYSVVMTHLNHLPRDHELTHEIGEFARSMRESGKLPGFSGKKHSKKKRR